MSDAILEQAAAQVRATRAGMPIVRAFFDAASCTASYVIHDPATGRAAIIDSVADYDPDSGRTSSASADALIAYVQEQGLAVDWLLETHAHADHFSAAPHLQAKLGGKIAIGRHIVHVQQEFGKLFNLGERFGRDAVYFDRLLEDGDRFSVGEIDGIALHVPGHTPVDMAFVIGDAVFTGDTIFMPDYGTARADFPGGDARQLYRSIRRLLSLPDQTRLFLCHDYKAPDRDDYRWETTVGAQRAGNVHVHDGVSEDEFVAMRQRRDATLGMPRLMLPAIQVNIRGGRLPTAEENGIRYLKIPLDAL
jgi:glyoxylase-like metal-dependent hydrolase (beta-lactamase superfamily II)